MSRTTFTFTSPTSREDLQIPWDIIGQRYYLYQTQGLNGGWQLYNNMPSPYPAIRYVQLVQWNGQQDWYPEGALFNQKTQGMEFYPLRQSTEDGAYYYDLSSVSEGTRVIVPKLASPTGQPTTSNLDLLANTATTISTQSTFTTSTSDSTANITATHSKLPTSTMPPLELHSTSQSILSPNAKTVLEAFLTLLYNFHHQNNGSTCNLKSHALPLNSEFYVTKRTRPRKVTTRRDTINHGLKTQINDKNMPREFIKDNFCQLKKSGLIKLIKSNSPALDTYTVQDIPQALFQELKLPDEVKCYLENEVTCVKDNKRKCSSLEQESTETSIPIPNPKKQKNSLLFFSLNGLSRPGDSEEEEKEDDDSESNPKNICCT